MNYSISLSNTDKYQVSSIDKMPIIFHFFIDGFAHQPVSWKRKFVLFACQVFLERKLSFIRYGPRKFSM